MPDAPVPSFRPCSHMRPGLLRGFDRPEDSLEFDQLYESLTPEMVSGRALAAPPKGQVYIALLHKGGPARGLASACRCPGPLTR